MARLVYFVLSVFTSVFQSRVPQWLVVVVIYEILLQQVIIIDKHLHFINFKSRTNFLNKLSIIMKQLLHIHTVNVFFNFETEVEQGEGVLYLGCFS